MPITEVKKSDLFELVKRLMDIVCASILIVIFSPVILIVAIAIKLDSSGPIFADVPCRVGRRGEPFKMYKFRSMVENAHAILRENPKFEKLYDRYKKNSFKLKDDPRITKVGHFIRKHSLDEVPQLFNILKGDELKEQQVKYPQTQHAVSVVLSIKPGLTGYWQVSGRSEINFDKRIEMDATYVRKRSIIYDLWIILKTPWAMISGQGAL